MAAKNGTITVRILGDSSGFEKVLGGTEKALGGLGSTVSKLGGLIAGAFAVDKIVEFGRGAIDAASDLDESLSKVNVVFGKNAASIEKWASSAATNMGMSKQQALEAAGTFGNLLTAMKLQPKAIKDMSTGMIQLASDLASFNNASPEETLLALRAGLTGETEPLKRFGVNLNAARIEAYALEKGLAKSKDELTAGAKAQAAYALIMEDTKTAQGDFARTSDGLANKQRILAARFKDIQAQVGSFLLPIFLKVTTVVADSLQPAFEALVAFFRTTVAPIVDQIGGAFEEVFDTIKGAIGSFVDAFRSGEGSVGESAGKLRAIVGQVQDVFASVFGAIKVVVVTVVDFLRVFWRVFGDDLVSFAREAWAGILETIRGALNVIAGIFDLIEAVLTGKWGEAWDALKRIVDGAWDTIFAIIRQAVTNVIPTMLAGLGQTVSSVARTAFDGLKEAFKGALNWIIDRWNGLDFEIGGWKVGAGPFAVTLPKATVGLPHIPRFHDGGVVPGRPGTEIPALLEPGEVVLTAAQAKGVGGNVTVIVHGSVVTERQLVDAVHQGLLQKQARGNRLGF